MEKKPKKLSKEEKRQKVDTRKEAVAVLKRFELENEQDEQPHETEMVYSNNGRPTKYSPAIIKKTYEYINRAKDQFYNYQKGFGATDTYERRVIAHLPTLEGLALYLNVHRDTVHAWSKKYPSFSDALDLLMAVQRERLQNRSLSGDYNPTIAKLILSANHGMRERSDVTTDDQPLPAPVTVNNYTQLSDEDLIKLAKGGPGRTS